MNKKEGFIDVVGGRVWYKIVGAGSKEVPLLVLHGGPGVPHDYLEPLEELADERDVIFYDQLGCGLSDKPNDPSLWVLDRFVEELSQVRAALGLDQIHILGNSWGSMLATAYMQDKKPKGVLSLTLSGPCLSASRWANDQRAYLKELPVELQETINKAEAANDYGKDYQSAMMEYYRRHICMLPVWPECLNRSFSRVNRDIYNQMWGASEFTMTGNLKTFERAERLSEIDVPILFTCGEFDEATPKTTAYYKGLAKNAQIKVFQGASHSHYVEKKDEYIKTVREFFQMGIK